MKELPILKRGIALFQLFPADVGEFLTEESENASTYPRSINSC